MTPIEKVLSMINPPASPVPDDMKTKAIQYALNAIRGIPGDVVKSTQAAVNISPPADLARKLTTNKDYEYYGGVPYDVQKEQAIQNIKDAVQASHLFGYAGAVRPFASNPLELLNGQTATRLGSGRGWSITDRITGL